MLLRGWNDAFHRFGISQGLQTGAMTTVDAAARALLAAPSLSTLFPDPRPETLRFAPSTVSCDWALSIDSGGSVSAFVGGVIDQMLMVSAVRLENSQLAWTFENFWIELKTTVDAYRDLTKGLEANFPVIVGLGGLRTPELSSMERRTHDSQGLRC